MVDRRRFRRDLIWNLGSTVIFGAVGIILHLLVGRYYGAATLGTFSQVVAVYLVLSQICVAGLVFSTMHHSNALREGDPELGRSIGSGLLLTVGQTLIVCLLAWIFIPSIGRFFDSPDTARGLVVVLPGLVCLTLNKYAFFTISGLGHLRAHAIAQSARWLLLLAALIALVAIRVDGALLPLIFSIEEALLLIPLLAYLYRIAPFRLTRDWISRHLRFSLRTSLSAVLVDANSRVDVIVLGYFASDTIVGIYGFAAMLAEGVIHVATVVQTNITPILGRLRTEGRREDIRDLVAGNIKRLCPTAAGLAVLGTMVFGWFAETLTGTGVFSEGTIYFAVLATGMVLASSYYPFHYVLNQWGYPTWFMVFNGLIVATNVVLNFILIPRLGALGAAFATALSWTLSIAYLKTLTRAASGVAI